MNTEKSIANNGLTLFPATPNTEQQLLLSTGSTTSFSFEMPLTAGIPETVKCSQINVNYTISAHIEYKTTNTNSVQKEEIKKSIILARLPENGILNGENYPSTIDSLKHFSNWCQYRITIDKKSVALGSRLPVKIEVAPTIIGLRLKQVFLQLIERRTITPELDGIERTNQSCHFIYPAKNNNLQLPARPLASAWQGQCEYQIPFDEKYKLAHSTKSYPNFRVNHVLLVSLLISIPDNNKSGANSASSSRYSTRTISFQTQIDLLDSHLTQLEEAGGNKGGLPSYDCPISIEELEKLNRHGLNMEYPPPSYESLVAGTIITA
jgi:hypothetical protein